jgi:hypothetical protein
MTLALPGANGAKSVPSEEFSPGNGSLFGLRHRHLLVARSPGRDTNAAAQKGKGSTRSPVRQ